MPGETLSCTGCHESQNEAVPSLRTIASTRAPSEIEPWLGPPRGFGFKREVQPVLDEYCAGCHDGTPDKDGKTLPNFADARPGHRGFSESYHALHRYVLRPGPESDYHMFNPMEYHATSSPLVQMLLKGHHNVQPDAEAWERLYAWIDLNTPYHATWTEAVGEGRAAPQSARRIDLAKLYAGVDVDPEAMPEAPTATITPVMPQPLPPVKVDVPQVAGWPMDAAEAARRQAAAGGAIRRSIPIGGDPAQPAATLELALIPAGEFVMGDAAGMVDERQVAKVSIDKPFWMGTMEITNAQYALFDAEHDSRYIDMQLKDQDTPGYPANEPQQPVIRISWREAMDYCRWLSEKTGRKFSLPTEAQWEWACRAGTPTPLWFGGLEADFGAAANLSDVNVKKFALEGFRPKIVENPNPYQAFIPLVAAVDDHYQVTAPVGSFQPNPWGLCDMHGNVAEWTRSLYRPYPYDAADGRNAVDAPGKRVVRGGSWRDLPQRCNLVVPPALRVLPTRLQRRFPRRPGRGRPVGSGVEKRGQAHILGLIGKQGKLSRRATVGDNLADYPVYAPVPFIFVVPSSAIPRARRATAESHSRPRSTT